MKRDSTAQGAALIGDVVASRKVANRAHLHRELDNAVADANRLVPPIQSLSLTVGDEFQGLYKDIGSAIHAALLVRLHLFEFVEIRFGVGWGPLQVFDRPRLPFGQDGPAWWAARHAIDFLKRTKRQPEVPRGWNTACSIARIDSTRGPLPTEYSTDDEAARRPAGTENYLNAFLLCRDELVAKLTARQARHLLTLMRGYRQAHIAQIEGVSQSAVSQRAMNSGIYAIVQAHRAIQRETEWSLSASG